MNGECLQRRLSMLMLGQLLDSDQSKAAVPQHIYTLNSARPHFTEANAERPSLVTNAATAVSVRAAMDYDTGTAEGRDLVEKDYNEVDAPPIPKSQKIK